MLLSPPLPWSVVQVCLAVVIAAQNYILFCTIIIHYYRGSPNQIIGTLVATVVVMIMMVMIFLTITVGMLMRKRHSRPTNGVLELEQNLAYDSRVELQSNLCYDIPITGNEQNHDPL